MSNDAFSSWTFSLCWGPRAGSLIPRRYKGSKIAIELLVATQELVVEQQQLLVLLLCCCCCLFCFVVLLLLWLNCDLLIWQKWNRHLWEATNNALHPTPHVGAGSRVRKLVDKGWWLLVNLLLWFELLRPWAAAVIGFGRTRVCLSVQPPNLSQNGPKMTKLWPF